MIGKKIYDLRLTILFAVTLALVLGLVGSPRRNGRTAIIVRHALQLLKGRDFQVKEVSFSDAKITPCGIRCNYDCSRRPIKCPVDDDVLKVYDMFRVAYLVIVGSPVYGGLLPSVMYAFKERAQALVSNWPLTGKDVVLLLNCSWRCERPMHDLERFYGAESRIVGKTIIPNPHSKGTATQLTDDESAQIEKVLSGYL